MEIKIYGASDDLIEIEGDIRDEFYHTRFDKPSIVTIVGQYGNILFIRIVYGQGGMGVWSIEPFYVFPDDARFWEVPWDVDRFICPPSGGDDEYSDVLKIDSGEEKLKVLC